jgi:hypothetical protein
VLRRVLSVWRQPRAGTPYVGQAGHVPDTAVTGLANPPSGWLDMTGFSNQLCGGVLDMLNAQQVRATFFVPGVTADRYPERSASRPSFSSRSCCRM